MRHAAYAPLAAAALLFGAPPAMAQSDDPIVIHMRLVPGETRHYVTKVTYTTNTDARGPLTEELTAYSSIVTEDLVDDDAIAVRATYDSVSVGQNDADLDFDSLVGTQTTYRMHADGTVSDMALAGADPAATPRADTFLAWWPHFPEDGFHVGDAMSLPMALPLPLSGLQAARAPVRTVVAAAENQDNRVVVRIAQDLSVENQEVPLGPFGAAGVGSLSARGANTIRSDTDSGWLVNQSGDFGFQFKATFQGGEEHAVVGRYAASMILTGEDLSPD